MEPIDPFFPIEPPADAEQWTDDQWLAWLKATDPQADAEGGSPPATAAGRLIHKPGAQVLGQTMLGVYQAIYGQRTKPVIVVDANSDPEEDQHLSLHLDPDDPEQSYVVLRPDIDPPGSAD